MSVSVVESAQTFVDNFNETYAGKHEAFENQFWGTKMNLSSTELAVYSVENLSKTKADLENLLSDPKHLADAMSHLNALPGEVSDDTNLRKSLGIIVKMLQCNQMPEDAKKIREETNKIESRLEAARNTMRLGYYHNGETSEKEFHPMSSVGLRNAMRTSSDESVRKAAYDGLRSIGPFVCDNGFVEIVKLRNRLAKLLGKEDYYDYKVSNAEGFSKKRLFEILDGLEKDTRPLMLSAREELVKRYGRDALEPHNIGFFMAGSVIKKMDPYFPFSKSVERYLRSYAAMNITYKGATMCLDLLDREKKYSNGFCHWPVCAWVRPDGTWVPSKTNFTSLADPTAVGSGLTALTTLMHEAGHAAHFANIMQPSPLFSQERAPTSVAYAENQSMFLDSLVGDAAWRARYARTVDGEPIPFEIIEEEIRATQPFGVFQLRAMLVVSYFEKALYELPDDDVTAEKIISLADETEQLIQGGPSPRPLLSVPHIVSDEASCYYQGYTLAEMSVHQTRDWFKKKFGYIVDNPNVGPILSKAYWECGNSKPFLDIVRDLTGKDLDGEAWKVSLEENVDARIAREKEEYEKVIVRNDSKPVDGDGTVDLDMTVQFKDGDLLIADSAESGGLLEACKKFEEFVASRAAKKGTE